VAVNANVHLHTEVPLLAIARLMHLGVSLVGCILGRAGRTNDGGVHDRARAHLHPTSLRYLAHFGKQLFSQLVLLQQPTKLQQRRAVRYPLAPQVNAHESAQGRAIEQRFLASLVGQVEPVLHKVHAQHTLQSHLRATISRLGVMRLDHFA
jgi:hypothetical protein